MAEPRAPARRSSFTKFYEQQGWLLVCSLPALAMLALREPMPVDETRYLSVAWEMWSSGHYLLPVLNGAPYTDKPPLLFWLIHVGWSLFGVNAWWPRCIPALAAVASTWLLRRLTLQLYPQQRGVADAAAWLLAGTLAWAVYSTVLLFDLLLVTCVVAAIVALERVERAPLTSWCTYGAAVVCGLMAKGPPMLIFALAPALAGPWWSAGAARQLRRWYAALVAALLAAIAAAAAWVIPAYSRARLDFIQTVLWHQSAMRIVHSYAHARPWWTYLLLLPLLLFPWSAWPAAWRGLRADGERRADRLAVTGVVPAFVVFSLISGKQPHYLLPIVPMAVLWLAPRVSRTDSGDRHGIIRRVALANATTIGLLMLVFFSTIGQGYQLRRASAIVRDLSDRGVPVAWIGSYEGELNFLARLQRPLDVLDPRETDRVEAWITAHPDGRFVTYSPGGEDGVLVPAAGRQRYRSGWLAVVPALESSRDVQVAHAPTGDAVPSTP